MQLIYVNGTVIMFSVFDFFFILYTAKMMITFLYIFHLLNRHLRWAPQICSQVCFQSS